MRKPVQKGKKNMEALKKVAKKRPATCLELLVVHHGPVDAKAVSIEPIIGAPRLANALFGSRFPFSSPSKVP